MVEKEIKESPKKWAMVKIDDTVAMAEKYRKLAKKDLLEQIVVNDNTINMVLLKFMSDPKGIKKFRMFKFFLNGKEYTGEMENDGMITRQQIIEHILDSMGKEIARAILIENRTIFTKN